MTLEEIIQYLGLDLGENPTKETLNQKFLEKFITIDAAKKDDNIRAAHMATIYSGIDKVALDLFGSHLTDEQKAEYTSSGKTKEKLTLIQGAIQSKLTELETKANSTDDEALIELQGKVEKLEKARDTFKASAADWQEKYNVFVDTTNKAKAASKKEAFVKSIYDGLKFSDTASEFEKIGFQTAMSTNYDIIEEDEKFVIRDKDGKPIPNPNNAGAEMTPEEVHALELNKANLAKKNNVQPQTVTAPTQPGDKPLRKVNAAALANAQ